MQWLQNPNQTNKGNMNKVKMRRFDIFQGKNEYLKTKFDELETKSENQNNREFERVIKNFKRA
jgi:hypothetical protein